MTNDIKIVVSKDYRDTKSKEEHIADYIESLVAIEEARITSTNDGVIFKIDRKYFRGLEYCFKVMKEEK